MDALFDSLLPFKRLAIALATLLPPVHGSAAPAMPAVSDGLYKIQCGDSVADGGQLNGKGVLEIRGGRASGALYLELNVSSDGVDSPEAEQHILPSLNVEGLAAIAESPLASTDGRPARLVLDLTATNFSIKERISGFTLIHNNAPQDGDEENSRLVLDRRVYTGVCTIEQK